MFDPKNNPAHKPDSMFARRVQGGRILHSSIKSIPGDLYLSAKGITKLENLPSVSGDLELAHNKIKIIENLPDVGGTINLAYNPIEEIKELKKEHRVFMNGCELYESIIKHRFGNFPEEERPYMYFMSLKSLDLLNKLPPS